MIEIEALDGTALSSRAAQLPLGDSCFASVGFAELWRELGGEPRYRVLWLDGEVAGVLPAVEFGRGPLRRLQSMPDGCYGSLKLVDEARPEKCRLVAALLEHLREEKFFRMHLVDYADELGSPDGMDAVYRSTRLADIRDPEWFPDDAKIRGQIRSAERQGVSFEPFDWEKHGEGYLSLAKHTAARQNRAVVYPPSFFERLAALSQTDPRVHWIWFEWEGEPACSHIYVREGDMLVEWQIQFDKRFSRQKPNQYMRWKTCREFALQGCTHLNLGAAPEDAVTLTYYKRRWSDEAVRYRTCVQKSLLAKVFRR